MTESTPGVIEARYFDGRSARARPVRLQVAAGRLHIVGEEVDLQLPLSGIRWPERTRHGARVAHLRDGGSVQALDAAAWDAWAKAAGLRESPVVRAQQNWRATLIAVAVLLLAGAASYQWGVPWLGRSALLVVPGSVDRAIGEAAQHSLQTYLLLPSQVPAARQQQVRDAFANAVARADPQHRLPAYELHFASSAALPERAQASGADKPPAEPDAPRRTRLGPNAFALPGGIVFVTDDMLALLQGRDDVLVGVLAHELGHVKRRHGMRLVVQASVLGAVASLVWGDFSTLLATVPVLLGQSAYSRDFEREADDDAIALLRANRISPAVMAELFERMAAQRNARAQAASGGAGRGGVFDGELGISFASHPDDAERIQHFREAAR